jgi:hypothetical protein
LEDEAAISLLLRGEDPENVRVACDWADDRGRALDGTGRELARLYAARLTVSCLWAAGRADDAQAALPVAVECARHGLIRFLLDGGPHAVATTPNRSSSKHAAAQARAERGLHEIIRRNEPITFRGLAQTAGVSVDFPLPLHPDPRTRGTTSGPTAEHAAGGNDH